jgi:hypothetical protein
MGIALGGSVRFGCLFNFFFQIPPLRLEKQNAQENELAKASSM